MEEKNLGVLVAPPRPKDYVLGGPSSIEIIRLVKDWSNYLPAVESQRSKVTDFLDCVTMSALHSIECQLNYLMYSDQLSDEALFFFHNNGYIYNGSFSLSERFNAKLNGTDKTKGNYLNVVGDGIRRDGLIPTFDLPMTENMTWDEFYQPIAPALIAKAKKVLWFIDIKYQWISQNNFMSVLNVSPIQVATQLCPGWDSGHVVQKCSGQPLNHATLIYAREAVTFNWLNLDHYPPFKQKLASDYEFPVDMQYVVTVKPMTLRNGMNGKNVLQLQKDLNKLGYSLKEDGDFGNKTQNAVSAFQSKNHLICDGIAGPQTLTKVKQFLTPLSLVDALIMVESQGNDYAVGDKNLPNKAYGCLQIRQPYCDDVNKCFHGNYKAIDCLGNRALSIRIFNLYMQIYGEGKTDEQKARIHNGGPDGWKRDSTLAYWKKVKDLL